MFLVTNKMITKFLHGNLQNPAVWEPFAEELAGKLEFVDLRNDEATDCGSWAKAFNQKTVLDCASDENRFLVGYSLGGRLALHALIENPTIWAGAVIIGAHPGSDNTAQRETWLKNDQNWAKRFLEEPWEPLMREWDALSVFGGIPNPCPRSEADFDRNEIARTFVNFSKGRQDYLTPRLIETDLPPILYLSGDKDSTYTKLGRELAELCSVIEHKAIPGAAHRVPWENPERFVEEVKTFLEQW